MLTPTVPCFGASTRNVTSLNTSPARSQDILPAKPTEFNDEGWNQEVDQVLLPFGLPVDVTRIITSYQPSLSLALTEDNSTVLVDVFSREGNLTFKRALIKKALDEHQVDALNQLFEQISHQSYLKNPDNVLLISGANLNSVDIRGLDLRAVKKDYVILTNCFIVGELLTERFVQGLKLTGSTLTGHFKNIRNFKGASLIDATIEVDNQMLLKFDHATLNKVTLPTDNSRRCYEFIHARLTDIDLSHRQIRGDFECAKLYRINLHNSTLTQSTFFRTIWINVNVAGADLSGLRLESARLTNVNISQAASVQGMSVSDKTMEGLSSTEQEFLRHCIEQGSVIKTGFDEAISKNAFYFGTDDMPSAEGGL